MSRFINAVAIGIVAFIVIVAGLWYVIEVGDDSELDAAAEARWAGMDGNRTILAAQVTVANPHAYSVELERVSYELAVNGKRLDWGEIDRTALADAARIPAGKDVQVDFEAAFPSSFLDEWLRDHAREGGSTSLLHGSVEVIAQRDNRSVDFEVANEWTVDLVDMLEGAVANCPNDEEDACVSDSGHKWVIEEDRLAIRSVLEVQHDGEGDRVLDDIRAVLVFGDTVVARGETGGDLVVKEDGNHELDLLLWFDSGSLAQWWPSHAQACEESEARLVVLFDETRDEGEPESTPTPSPPNATATTTVTRTTTASPSATTTTTSPTTSATSATPSPAPTPTGNNSASEPDPTPSPSPTPTANGLPWGASHGPGASRGVADLMEAGAQRLLAAIGLGPEGTGSAEEEEKEEAVPEPRRWSFDLGTYRTAFVCPMEAKTQGVGNLFGAR